MSKRSASELSVDEQQPQSKQRREESDEKAGVVAALPATLPTTCSTSNSTSTSSSSHSMSDTIMNEMNQPALPAAAAAASAFTSSSASSSSPHSSASAVSVSVSDPIRVCGIDVWHCEQLRHDMTQLLKSVTVTPAAVLGEAVTPSNSSHTSSTATLPTAAANASSSSPLINLSLVAAATDLISLEQRQQQQQQQQQEQLNSSIQSLCKRVIDIGTYRASSNWIEEMIRAGGIQGLVLIANKTARTLTTDETAAATVITSTSTEIEQQQQQQQQQQQIVAARTLLERHFSYSTITCIIGHHSVYGFLSAGQLESILESFLIHDLANIVLEYQSLAHEEVNILANGGSEEQQMDQFDIQFDDHQSHSNANANANAKTKVNDDSNSGSCSSNNLYLNQLIQDLNSSIHYDLTSLQFVAALTFLIQFVSHSLANRDAAIDAGIMDLMSSLLDRCIVGTTGSPLLETILNLLISLTRMMNPLELEVNVKSCDHRSIDLVDLIMIQSSLKRGLYFTDEKSLVSTLTVFEQLSLSLGIGQAHFHFLLDGCAHRLVELLIIHRSPIVKFWSLRVVLNLTRGTSESHRRRLLDCNVCHCLLTLLVHPKKQIRRCAIMAIGRLIRGSTDHLELIINANIIPPLVSALRNEEYDIQQVAAWTITNALSGGTDPHIRYLVGQGVIQPLCALFDAPDAPDAKIIMVVLEGIENILRVGKKEAQSDPQNINAYAALVEGCKGLDYLEALQHHENKSVYIKAVQILQTYFVSPEEEK